MNKKIIISITILIVLLITLWKYLDYSLDIKTIEYNAKAEILNATENNITKLGISADTNELNFGRAIYKKTNITKIITIENPYSLPVKTIIYAQGNISEVVTLPEPQLVKPGQKIDFYVKLIANQTGNFTGKIIVEVIIPKNKLAEKYMVYRYA